ncbi:cytochrome c oxidase subunit II [candidate division GN15 bacterium]|nr:cytochrome c oxidase subunit II [candidate division GN15 bacterium]
MDSTSSLWMPSQSSTMAEEVDALFNFILGGSAVIFGLVCGAIILFLLRYRRRGKVARTDGRAHNTTIEILWTAIPTVLIIIVFFWGFKSYIRMHVTPHEAAEIKVTGQKWFWSFDYPEGATAVNELVVPVNKPIKLLMSSTDVIHSFFVPNFRMKMDVLPNRYTVTWFEATEMGEFDLYCTEFCGSGHSEMIGKVRVVDDSGYAAWLDANSNLGEGMTLVEFGEMLYERKACITCHSVDGTPKDGPSFLGRYGTEVLMSDGQQVAMDENYMRESILNPQAKIVNGYQPIMPTYQGVLKDREIDALVAFIKSVNGEETVEAPEGQADDQTDDQAIEQDDKI